MTSVRAARISIARLRLELQTGIDRLPATAMSSVNDRQWLVADAKT